MSYLVINDFKKQIQEKNLNQVIGSDTGTLNACMLTAQAEAISYLVQKYDVTAEFTETLPWSSSIIYKAANRITIDYAAYVPATSYVLNNLVINAGIGYICIGATTGAFDQTKWTAIGNQYDIYYAIFPHPQFNVYSTYLLGDQVFWKGKIYTCKKATGEITHELALQYGTYENLPLPNIFPDDPVNGVIFWGSPTAYSIAAGILPTNATYWIKGDNRDQQMLTYLIDISLYHAHSRIAPSNVPEKISFRYMGRPEDVAVKDGHTTFPSYSALGWLQACARGEVTPVLPVKQPAQGKRIRWGGNVKNINTY